MNPKCLCRRLFPLGSALVVALSIPTGLADEVAGITGPDKPRLANEVARITGFDKTGTAVTVRFAGVAGVTYAVEGTNDLLSWTPLESVLGTGGEMSVPLAGEGAQASRFFRVMWQDTSPVPGGMSLIPAGGFEMGQAGLAEPVHTVQVSAFYLGKHEVNKALWDEVQAWGLLKGYVDLPTGSGKEAGHPVHTINWFAMVKWCNARSEKVGLTPCYTISGETYKTGDSTPDCNWNANGYRLPSEAEWEKAARGGLNGKLFPWGDIINHSYANYNSYNESPQNDGYHPVYSNGDAAYSSPVGSFVANEYGLHDMAGNMKERCWDRHAGYTLDSQVDPHGPDSGSNRVIRGGSWQSYAPDCRVASRPSGLDNIPGAASPYIGFRVARTAVQ